MKKYKIFTTGFAAFFMLSSCLQSKKLYYFHDQVPSVQQLDSLRQFTAPKVQNFDKLNIHISSTDPALTAYLNPFGSQTQGSANAGSGANGYLVNSDGQIEFPILGKIAVSGLTTVEIATEIKNKLAYYYKDLFVNVNLNGRVYFMSGRTGSTIAINNERLTIFEAISQANQQMDPYDIKDKMWLIREDSGKRYFVNLDLNSKKIFESPYYYLRNNDLLYVKPGRFSSVNSISSPFRASISILGSIASAIGFVLLIKNLF